MSIEITASRAATVARAQWGPGINTQRKIARDIWWFTTPGHGGYVLLSPSARPLGIAWSAVTAWETPAEDVLYAYAFEEDCAWAVLENERDDVRFLAWMDREILAAETDNDMTGMTFEEYTEYVRDTVAHWHPECLPTPEQRYDAYQARWWSLYSSDNAEYWTGDIAHYAERMAEARAELESA